MRNGDVIGLLSFLSLSSPLFSSDPVVASLAQDIFKELAQIEGCQGPMQMRLIPTLVSIMQAPPDKIPSGLCAVSIRHEGLLASCMWCFLNWCETQTKSRPNPIYFLTGLASVYHV